MKNNTNKTWTALAAVMLAGFAAPMATADHGTNVLLCDTIAPNPRLTVAAGSDEAGETYEVSDAPFVVYRAEATASHNDLRLWATSLGPGNPTPDGAELLVTIYKEIVHDTPEPVPDQTFCEPVSGALRLDSGTSTSPVVKSNLAASAFYRVVIERNLADGEMQVDPLATVTFTIGVNG